MTLTEQMARLLRPEESMIVVHDPDCDVFTIQLRRRRLVAMARITPNMPSDAAVILEELRTRLNGIDGTWYGQGELEPIGCPPVTAPASTVPILLEFAKAGKREDFEWLAGSAGVKPEQMEELWKGTLARVGPRHA